MKQLRGGAFNHRIRSPQRQPHRRWFVLLTVAMTLVQTFMGPINLTDAGANGTSGETQGSLIISDKVFNDPTDPNSMSVTVTGNQADKVKEYPVKAGAVTRRYDSLYGIENDIDSLYMAGSGKIGLVFPKDFKGDSPRTDPHFFDGTTVTVNYAKAGYLRDSNGDLQPVSARLTVRNIKRSPAPKWDYPNDQPYLDFASNMYSGMNMGGIASVDLQFEFFTVDGRPVNFGAANGPSNGYLTFNSLNGYGKGNQSGEYVKAIDPEKNTIINKGAWIKETTILPNIGDDWNALVSPIEHAYSSVVQGGDVGDTIGDSRFVNRSVQYALNGSSNSFTIGTGGDLGYSGWFAFASAATTPIVQTAPSKTVQPLQQYQASDRAGHPTGAASGFAQRYFDDLDRKHPLELPLLDRVSGHNADDPMNLAPGIPQSQDRYIRAGQPFYYYINQPTINLTSEGLIQPTGYTITDTLPQNIDLAEGGKFIFYDLEGNATPLNTGTGTGQVQVNGKQWTYHLTPAQATLINQQSAQPAHFGAAFTIQFEAQAQSDDGKEQDNRATSTFMYENTSFTRTSNAVTVMPKADQLLLAFKKVDTAGQPLANATFTVTDKDGKEYGQAISTADGRVEFTTGLPVGEGYQLKETDAPAGYELIKPITFDVQLDAQGQLYAQITDGDQGGQHLDADHALIDEKSPAKLTVIKQDSSQTPLAGAEFTLYRYDATSQKLGDPIGDPITTDQAGQAQFDALDWAQAYRLVETKAPQGYRLPDVKDPKNWLPVAFDANTLSLTKTVQDQRKPVTLQLQKKDSITQQTLKGAKFTLTGPDAYQQSQTSDEEGRLAFTGLQSGTTYTLKEAPLAGYQAGAAYHVIVSDDGTQVTLTALDADGHEKAETSQKHAVTVTSGDTDNTAGPVTITNTPTTLLPHTGGVSRGIMLVALVLLALAVALLGMRTQLRHKEGQAHD